MHTSIIDRPEPHNLRPSSGAAVRTYQGEVHPAVGPWIVGRGQKVMLTKRGWLHRAVEATVFEGSFLVAENPANSSLDITLTVADVAGFVRIRSDGSRSLDARYHGVFHRAGSLPSLWLTVRAELLGCDVPGLKARRGVTVVGDLNLNPAQLVVQPR